MLKFLRKYQLFILAVGGSLLMVVFLLQPILQQLAPNPANSKVAELTADGTTVTRGDRERARFEVQALREFAPWLIEGMGLDPAHEGDHWLLLTHVADKAGLIGEAGDGANWEQELVTQLTTLAFQAMLQQGRFPTQEEQLALPDQMREQLALRREAVITRFRYPATEFDRLLARARGVFRYRAAYAAAPRFSDRRLIDEAQAEGAAAIADALVLSPSFLNSAIEAPTEQQLLEHLETYGDVQPGDTEANPFGLGYRLPNRIHLEWLRLDPVVFEGVAQVDRVELRKRWQRENPDGSDEDFAAARANLERQIRAEVADEIMAEADQVVRGELLRLMRPLESDGRYLDVPGDWPAAGPDYESIARLVVRQVGERLGITIPLPTVERRTSAWMTGNELADLPGLGEASFRVGAQNIPVPLLPNYVREIDESDTLKVQVGVPILDPFATGADGSRYYITVLAARAESAPDSLDEVRAQVVRNARAVAAYDRLAELGGEARTIAAESGLDAVASFIAAEARVDAATQAPQPVRDLRVERNRVTATLPGDRAPQNLQTTDFTAPVIEVARGLDPFAPIDTVDPFDSLVVVNLPQQPAVVIAKVRALRPMTAEQYRSQGESLGARLLQQTASEFVRDAESSPFSLDKLAQRLGYTFDYRAEDEDLLTPAGDSDNPDADSAEG